MVKYANVLSTNNSFFSTKAAANLTAVFVGATNGIGLGTLRAFTKHTSGASPTVYIVGRSQKGLSNLISSLQELNASAKFNPIIVNDLTVVKDAQKAADEIASKASKADLLVMTPGYLSLKYEDNGEGLDRLQAIRHYSRFRFLLTLTPLLKKSSSPRVVSVLGAGTEGALFPDDMTLKDHYSLPNAAGAAGSMHTLFLEEYVKQPGNGDIAVAYTFPGLTSGTGLHIKGAPGWAQFLLDWVAFPLLNLFGSSVDEVGERTLYGATNEQFVPRSAGIKEEGKAAKGSDGVTGSGVYLLHSDSSIIPGNKVLTGHREKGYGDLVWKHTVEKLEEIERS